MILTVPGWPGTFDADITYRHGSPASFGPNGGDPGDPDEFQIDFVVWEFDGRNSVCIEPKLMDEGLFALLEHAVGEYISKNPDAFQPSDGSEFDYMDATA